MLLNLLFLTLSVNGLELSTSLISCIDINRATSSVNEVSTSSINQLSTSLVNIISTLIKPTSSLQPIDYNRENSQVPLSWPVGVGFLLFTNFITIFMFIISCLWLQRSKGRHEKL